MANDYYYASPYYNMGQTMEPINPQMAPQNQMYYNQQPQYRPAPPVQQQQPELAPIKAGGFSFTVRKDDEAPKPSSLLHDESKEVPATTKKRRSRKSTTSTTDIVKADGSENEVIPTMYTYQETTNMLRGTLGQIDELASQVKKELDNVSSSRTLKSKYNIMVGLSSNLGDIMSTKIAAIREINNAITRSNELDYKRDKDRKAMDGSANDDKYIMDMYNAFIQNPMGANNSTALGPTTINATLGADDIVRASDQPMQQGFAPDMGYLSYVANMTPEQRLMSVEDNPNIKQCLVYDASTGNKVFQWMDMSTGQSVPGLPARDPMFLEDTSIDMKNKIAKNINLNETYPLVVINENVVNEY